MRFGMSVPSDRLTLGAGKDLNPVSFKANNQTRMRTRKVRIAEDGWEIKIQKISNAECSFVFLRHIVSSLSQAGYIEIYFSSTGIFPVECRLIGLFFNS